MRKDSRKAIEKPIIKRCCLLYEMLLTEKTTSTQNIVQLCKQYKKYKNEYRKSKCCA